MLRKVWFAILALSAITALALFAACGDDDDDGGDDGGGSDEERATVEALIRDLAATDPVNEDDVQFFLDHATDNFIEQAGYESPEDCRANADDCIGEPTEGLVFNSIEVEGDTAAVDVTFSEGEDEFTIVINLVKDGDTWKLDGFEFGVEEIPEGVKAIEVTATEYEFEYDAGAIEDGNVAFTLKNEGAEEHELIIFKVRDDFDINVLLEGGGDEGEHEEDEEELPPGAESFTGFTLTGPGDSANLVPEGELEPGRYVMACFIENDAGEAHVALGMHSEFTIE